ncbi:MAG TPA: type II secretion system protein [Vicinamibacterales bacterium]
MAPSTGTGNRRAADPARSVRSQGGWTLIELVVVMSIIAILAALAMTNHANAVRVAKEAALKEDLFRMRDAIDQYYADKGKYPMDLQTLVSEGYMREIPVDPFTQSRDTWQTIPAEPDPSNPSAEVGIYNVKSGTDQTSMNGEPLSEW